MTQVEYRRSSEVFALRIPLWKRAIDVAGALVILVLAAPVMIATALYIRLVSPGPALFRQPRIGWGGRPFTMWKFRTMHKDFDTSIHREHMIELIRNGRTNGTPMRKLDQDNTAIIPLGGFLRRSCIDELPQIFNVLAGEMSMVGPRPALPYEMEEFFPWHHHRFDVLPGLTGLWQVRGKNRLTFTEMIRLDLCYARRLSPARDLAIIMQTPSVIFSQLAEGAGANRRESVQPARRD